MDSVLYLLLKLHNIFFTYKYKQNNAVFFLIQPFNVQVISPAFMCGAVAKGQPTMI